MRYLTPCQHLTSRRTAPRGIRIQQKRVGQTHGASTGTGATRVSEERKVSNHDSRLGLFNMCVISYGGLVPLSLST